MEGLTDSIRSLSRKIAKLATHVLTGHVVLNYHMYKLSRNDTPDCRRCGEEEETSPHVLGRCPGFTKHRLLVLGSVTLEPE